MASMTQFMTQRFSLFIIGYFALQMMIRLLTTNIAVLDESEQIMLSQYFSWGYNEQPPLYTWVQMVTFKFFGISILGLTFLKNGLLCMTYLFVYKLGLLLMNDKLKASLSALSLMLIPQFVWDAQVDQTHTILLTTATTVTIYYFFKIVLKEDSFFSFAMFGLASGIGLNAKYNFVLVLVALAVVAWMIKEFRCKIYQKALGLSFGIAFLMVLPHFLWFISHLDTATERTINRMNVGHTHSAWLNFAKGIFDLFLSCIAFLTPFWLVFIGLFRKNFTFKLDNNVKALLGYMTVIFIFLFLMIALSGSTHIKERWLQPYLFLVPLFLFLHVKIMEEKNISRYLQIAIIAPIIVALVVLVRPFFIDMRGKPTRASYPFDILAHSITQNISSNAPLLLHAEDKYIGGNLKLFIPNALVITPSLPNQSYRLRDTVIAVWEHEKPLSLLKTLEEQRYQCSENETHILFKNSKKLTYNVQYMVCQK